MKRRMFMGAASALAVALSFTTAALAQDKLTIALIPGLTTDGFYITMHRGAQAAADALGVELVFQGAPDFNPVTQVPVLDAVIARAPDAILIAPTDKVQLVEPLRKAHDAGIHGGLRRYVDRHRRIPDRCWRCRFPDQLCCFRQRARRPQAARALAKAIAEKGKVYVSNVKPGISTTGQREEGFKLEMD